MPATLPTLMNDQKKTDEELSQRIEALARPIAASMGLELVEVFYRGGFSRGVLRLTIDKPAGESAGAPGAVSHDDCQAVSRVVGTQLEVEELIAQPYTLEVSSPGMDRRLRQPEEYGRYQGRLARVKTAGQVLVGRLEGLADGDVVIRLENGEARRVPMPEVLEARLVVEFGGNTTAGRGR